MTAIDDLARFSSLRSENDDVFLDVSSAED